jgi:colanic acid/amylovoran biosynthesis glycosyltransferase
VTLVYVLRSFPKLSETFVLREVGEHVRQGREIVVWALRPGPDEVALPAEVEAVVRRVRGGAGGAAAMAASSLRLLARRPLALLRALGFALRWSLAERDPRHLLALPFAAYVAVRLPADAHLHSHFANTPTTVALLAARVSGRPFSFTGHARDLYVSTSAPFLRAKVAEARFVALGTAYARAKVAEAVGADLEPKLVTVFNGLDVDEGGRPGARTQSEPPLVASVGRLVEKKGHATLVEASGLLVRRGVSHRCVIVGDGPLEAELESRARAAAAPVELLGPRSHEEVARLLGEASAFALACQADSSGDTDSMPLALLEAMAHGLPVVTTTIAGIPEFVTDGESGLLVEPRDPEAFAEALERVLGDHQLAERLGRGAAAAARRFDLRSNVERLYECAMAGEPFRA